MSARYQGTQINRPMKTLASVITNFECGKSGHFWSYEIYIVTVTDMEMASRMNTGKTTPPRKSSVLNVVILECKRSYML
jgi:hypothetical protein